MRAALIAFAMLFATARARAQADPDDYRSRAQLTRPPSAAEHVIDPGAAAANAGALGDPARALAAVAGVGRTSFDGDGLVLWGTYGDTPSYIDGVPLPRLMHLGGLRSVVHPLLLRDLRLTPGAPDPSFGRALGGKVELETAPLTAAGAGARFEASPLDASLVLRDAAGPVSLIASARLGYVAMLQRALWSNTRGILALPDTADGGAKLRVRLDDRSSLEALLLSSFDRVARGLGVVYADQAASDEQRDDFQVFALRYLRHYDDGASVRVTPYLTLDESRQLGRYGAREWLLAQHATRYGVRAEYLQPMAAGRLRLGMDMSALRTRVERTGTLTLPAREGDVRLFGQPPGDDVNHDDYTTYDLGIAPYLQLELRFGALSIAPGLRLEMLALSVDRTLPPSVTAPQLGRTQLFVRPEPRLEARWQMLRWLRLVLRAAWQYQPPAPVDRSAIFGTPALGLERGATIAAGPSVALGDTLTLHALGFVRRMWGLAVRSSANPPALARALEDDGKGRSVGAQLELDVRPARELSGSLAYTLSRSTRTDADGYVRLFDRDQPHVLSAVLVYRPGAWTFSARFRWSSGVPNTPVIGSYYDVRDGYYEPRFGDQNSARLPAFASLDLHAGYRLRVRGTRLELWLDALNVTDHANVEDYAYDFDYTRRSAIRGYPAMVLFGITWEL